MSTQTFPNGLQVRILFDMDDGAEDGRERVTPAGSIGRIDADCSEPDNWLVVFDNGAAGHFSTAELLDKNQCEVLQ